LIFAAFTCSSSDVTSDCPAPEPGSEAAMALTQARQQAGFTLLYPCYLPAGQTLDSTSVTGDPGRQMAEFVFVGPFDLRIRQAQYPPAVAPDPVGASQTFISLFPNVQATLIERNDGTRQAMYHLFWSRNGVYYELQAFGPPLQRRLILQIATSLE
jgi:hypothetical protein